MADSDEYVEDGGPEIEYVSNNKGKKRVINMIPEVLDYPDSDLIDLVMETSIMLQDYCRDNALPIFNRINTTNIIMERVLGTT